MIRTCLLWMCAVWAACAAPQLRAAPVDEALWHALRAGGHVVLMRHALTDPGIGDPAGFTLADCASQRNLSAQGREHARRIGAAFRQRAVPVDAVLSSHWCRCVDTATLAFGRVERARMLDSVFNDPRRPTADKADEVLAAAARHQGAGNLVMVTHAVNISALSGESVAPGEIVVLKLTQGRLAPLGRLRVP